MSEMSADNCGLSKCQNIVITVCMSAQAVVAIQNRGQMMKYTQLTYAFSGTSEIQKHCSEFNFLTYKSLQI